jgi:hypothetical protein
MAELPLCHFKTLLSTPLEIVFFYSGKLLRGKRFDISKALLINDFSNFRSRLMTAPIRTLQTQFFIVRDENLTQHVRINYASRKLFHFKIANYFYGHLHTVLHGVICNLFKITFGDHLIVQIFSSWKFISRNMGTSFDSLDTESRHKEKCNNEKTCFSRYERNASERNIFYYDFIDF